MKFKFCVISFACLLSSIAFAQNFQLQQPQMRLPRNAAIGGAVFGTFGDGATRTSVATLRDYGAIGGFAYATDLRPFSTLGGRVSGFIADSAILASIGIAVNSDGTPTVAVEGWTRAGIGYLTGSQDDVARFYIPVLLVVEGNAATADNPNQYPVRGRIGARLEPGILMASSSVVGGSVRTLIVSGIAGFSAIGTDGLNPSGALADIGLRMRTFFDSQLHGESRGISFAGEVEYTYGIPLSGAPGVQSMNSLLYLGLNNAITVHAGVRVNRQGELTEIIPNAGVGYRAR